jgi:hypothetical protein
MSAATEVVTPMAAGLCHDNMNIFARTPPAGVSHMKNVAGFFVYKNTISIFVVCY